MATTPKKGLECVLKVGAATAGKARDVELSASGNPVDITCRDSAGWKEFLMGLKEWEVSVDQVWVADDTALAALRAAFIGGTSVAIEVRDAAAGNGFTGTAFISSMKLGQPLDGGVMLPMTLKGTGALAPV
jgi:predicted secreted protein